MDWNPNPDIVFLPWRFLASCAMPNTTPKRVWTECCWDCSNPLRLPRCGPAAMCTVASRLVIGLPWLRVITVLSPHADQLTQGNKLEKHCFKLVFQPTFFLSIIATVHALVCIWSVSKQGDGDGQVVARRITRLVQLLGARLLSRITWVNRMKKSRLFQFWLHCCDTSILVAH